MVAIGLLSLIVLALMAVFDSAQTAFRASVTQTDVLEGGRMTMDLMTADLRQMAPSGGHNGSATNGYDGSSPVNFYASNNWGYLPLDQPLTGSNPLQTNVNVLENFFILGRGNLNGQLAWFGTGYVVDTLATNAINPLYRFYMTTNVAASPNPGPLFNAFMSVVALLQANTGNNGFPYTNWSHLVDGVVDLTVRAYDPHGIWMTNGYFLGYTNTPKNALFLPPALGECGFYLFSNTLPASVEIELGVLEDRALARAESLGGGAQPPSPTAAPLQWQYLQQQAGKVHLFRQRVTIPNVDSSAYQ